METQASCRDWMHTISRQGGELETDIVISVYHLFSHSNIKIK